MNDPWDKDWLPVLRFLINSDENIPGYTGYAYEGITLSRRDGGWFCVVRARRASGEHVVTFYAGQRLYEALWHLAYDVAHSKVKWSPDKYAGR